MVRGANRTPRRPRFADRGDMIARVDLEPRRAVPHVRRGDRFVYDAVAVEQQATALFRELRARVREHRVDDGLTRSYPFRDHRRAHG